MLRSMKRFIGLLHHLDKWTKSQMISGLPQFRIPNLVTPGWDPLECRSRRGSGSGTF